MMEYPRNIPSAHIANHLGTKRPERISLLLVHKIDLLRVKYDYQVQPDTIEGLCYSINCFIIGFGFKLLFSSKMKELI